MDKPRDTPESSSIESFAKAAWDSMGQDASEWTDAWADSEFRDFCTKLVEASRSEIERRDYTAVFGALGQRGFPNELSAMADQLQMAYGNLPKDRAPGPPTSIIKRLRELASTQSATRKFEEKPVAWLIERPEGTGKQQKMCYEVVLSPLTDDTFMDEGDCAYPLYKQRDTYRAEREKTSQDDDLNPSTNTAAGGFEASGEAEGRSLSDAHQSRADRGSHETPRRHTVTLNKTEMKHLRPQQMTRAQALKLINETPALQSLLYDMDLLPEQLKQRTRDWYNMMNIVEHFNIALRQKPRDAAQQRSTEEKP